MTAGTIKDGERDAGRRARAAWRALATALLIVGAVSTRASAADPAPVNISPPTFSGYLQVGATLTAQPGSWTGSPTSYSYRWFSCDYSILSCPYIAGATMPTYTIDASQVGHYIGVEIVATNAGGDSRPNSSDTAGPVSMAYPRNVAAPTIAGMAQEGETLVADPGSWTDNPTAYSYRWYRCDADITSCAAIGTATSSTYGVGAADVGSRLGVGVVATGSGGFSDEALSHVTSVVSARDPLAPVAPPAPPVLAPPADSSFTILRAGTLTNGRLVFSTHVRNAGTLAATATASAAALAKRCRPRCPTTARATYGAGTAKAMSAGTVVVTIKPGARARAALRRGRAIRVRARLTFSSALGGPSSTQVRTITVPRRPSSSAAR